MDLRVAVAVGAFGGIAIGGLLSALHLGHKNSPSGIFLYASGHRGGGGREV